MIFESYGWGDAAEVAKRIKTSLEEADYEVWIDSEHLRPDDTHFPLYLQEALEGSKLVVALLSPHSVRLEGEAALARRMSVCHNELILAVQRDIPVVPVTVVECDPPLAINHYDPIAFTDWQNSPDRYRAGIEEILRWIDEGLADRRRYRVYVDNLSRDRLSFAEEQTAEQNFVGRGWLFERIEAWLAGKRRCFLLEAEPGSGKTAFAAELVRHNPGGRVLAYHFCSPKSPRTLDPRSFVRSIAVMICGTVPGYAQQVRRSSELVAALQCDDPAAMLWEGLLKPLGRLDHSTPRYIAVDALDEPASGERPTIAQLLAEQLENFPPWLRLMLTTRRDDRILPLFGDVERCFLGDSVAQQQEDLRAHVERSLADAGRYGAIAADAAARDRLVATILERSAGNFQYASTVLEELCENALDIGEIPRLPKSLAALYHRVAAGRFPTRADFTPARHVLGLLLAARQPLSLDQLAAITGLDRDGELSRTLDKLSRFVTWDNAAANRHVYRPAHKSIADWLTAPPSGSDQFRIDPQEGQDKLLEHCRKWSGHCDAYALVYLIEHLLEGGFVTEAVAAVEGGFFAQRRGRVDPRCDLDDARRLTLALVGAANQAAIIKLARTTNVWQRDGVAAALQSAPPETSVFVDRVVAALLQLN